MNEDAPHPGGHYVRLWRSEMYVQHHNGDTNTGKAAEWVESWLNGVLVNMFVAIT